MSPVLARLVGILALAIVAPSAGCDRIANITPIDAPHDAIDAPSFDEIPDAAPDAAPPVDADSSLPDAPIAIDARLDRV